ncbi:MAG: hypothetical protein A4S14_01875 [Proteobacteria bacterium SG_bin9]|nr:MAG: hypothetical protein A4S14_01875 [Proteobacteria bacterium SG_bin9]
MQVLLGLAAFIFAALAITATLTISPSMLTHWKVQYATSGGTFLEKLHPATYLTCIALLLTLLRFGNPFEGLVATFARSKTTILYLICWVLLLVQTVMLQRPFTGVVDTFLLPLLLAVVLWQLSPLQRSLLAPLVHGLILLNVMIGYYEYFAGHRIIPLTLGNVLVVGEWRSAALFGHPLVASGVVAAYILALSLNPRIVPSPLVRMPLIALCLGSLMAFGGRTALVTTLGLIALAVGARVFGLMRGGRISLPALIAAILVAFAGLAIVFAALNLGLFDKMLLRFSSDKGSTLARYATWQFLSHFDWWEILFGPSIARANALQNQLGLDYGIENFWIASTVQFGLLHTLMMTAALIGFLVKILRQSAGAAIALVVLMTVIAASSVSFSSKNLQLTQFVILMIVLLPKAPPVPRASTIPQRVVARPQLRVAR